MSETFEELVKLVEKMRRSQKAYFQSRSKEDLDESKRLEREVDSKLIEWNDKQLRLFND